MQQTETYKLNLIETSDTFSPAPLNENMEKLETAITAGSEAGAEADAALDQRITALEVHKIATGTYNGTAANYDSTTQTISLGFTPKFVFVQPGSNVPVAVLPNSTYGAVRIQPDGFIVCSTFNNKTTVYTYLAFC